MSYRFARAIGMFGCREHVGWLSSLAVIGITVWGSYLCIIVLDGC